MASVSKLMCGFAAATLLPRAGSLWQVASRKGRRVVAVQCAILGLMSIKSPPALPPWCVPAATSIALLFDTASAILLGKAHRMNKVFREALWAVLTVGMTPSFYEAIEQGWAAITDGEADVPALIAMVLGLLLRQVRAVAVILLMLTGGEAFEEHALQQAGNALHTLLAKSPGIAHVTKGDPLTKQDAVLPSPVVQLNDIPAEQVSPGDYVYIKHGEVVPVDGSFLRMANNENEEMEFGTLDESLLTGEMQLVHKRLGDQVFAGSLNMGAGMWLCASRAYRDSIMALMQAKLADALDAKAPLELESKRVVTIFTPVTLFLAAISSIVSEVRGKSNRAMWEAVLAVFMSATPCPAGIGVPIALLSGMSVANRKFGCTIKNGSALETLGKTSVVVLDKTGTLTVGNPRLMSLDLWESCADVDDFIALKLLASVEQESTHPLAKAIVDAFHAKHKGENLLSVKGFNERIGEGVFGTVEDMEIRVGSASYAFAEAAETMLSQTHNMSDASRDSGIVSYFSITSTRAHSVVASGQLKLRDEIRPSAFQLVDTLQNSLGIEVVILSGDRSGHLEEVAKQLGISKFESCWPHEKAERINTLKRDGHVVLMVGDGANDTTALAAADVGMSVGADNLAAESASIVLMNEDLNNVSSLIKMSQQVVDIAKRTVYTGMTASMLQMLGASLGAFGPFVSAVGQEIIDLGSVVHALRALAAG